MGCRPHATRPLRLGSGQAFCFGKSTQNHIRPCAAPSTQFRTGPRGASASAPNPPTPLRTGQDGCATRGVYPEFVEGSFVEGLKQCSPEGSIRYCGSAAPNAGDTQETNQVFKLGSNPTKTHFPFIFRSFPKIILSLGSKSLPDFPVVQNNYTRCTSKCVLRRQW